MILTGDGISRVGLASPLSIPLSSIVYMCIVGNANSSAHLHNVRILKNQQSHYFCNGIVQLSRDNKEIPKTIITRKFSFKKMEQLFAHMSLAHVHNLYNFPYVYVISDALTQPRCNSWMLGVIWLRSPLVSTRMSLTISFCLVDARQTVFPTAILQLTNCPLTFDFGDLSHGNPTFIDSNACAKTHTKTHLNNINLQHKCYK